MNEAGVGYVPADRHRFGLILSFPIAGQPGPHQLLPPAVRARLAARRRGHRRERRGSDRRATTSGRRRPRSPAGDALRAATSRRWSWPASSTATCALLVLDQPTRGLDVGSIEFIHRQIIAKRDAGTAVLLVSAELDEVLEMSDRIAVMYRGQLVAVRDGRTADKNEIGLLMATGGRTQAAPRRRRAGVTADGRTRPPAAAALGRRWPVPAVAIILALARRARSSSSSSACSSPAPAFDPAPAAARPTGRWSNGSLGSFDGLRRDVRAGRAAAPGRPGRGARLQGRPVQHRRPGPVPDGRARAGLGRRRRSPDAPPLVSIPLALAGRGRSSGRSGPASPATSRRPRAPTRWSPRSCSTTSPWPSCRGSSSGRCA